MNYKNNTDHDIQLPILSKRSPSGVVRAMDHIAVKIGQIVEVPENSIQKAISMGLDKTSEKIVIVAEKSSIGEVEVETKQIEPAAKEVESDLYTEEALFDLVKAEQVTILESLGVEKIPRYEKDRVALILELQEAQ